MKKLLILLGMLAGVVAPSLAHANPDNQSTKTRNAKTRMVVKAPRPQRRTVYYIRPLRTAAPARVNTPRARKR